jgi:hypothetical protein
VAITYSSLILIPRTFSKETQQHSCPIDENIQIDRRIGSKNILCYGDEPKILAAKTGNGNNISLSNIKLGVNETNWEDKGISCVLGFGEKAVIRVERDKPNIQTTLHNY